MEQTVVLKSLAPILIVEAIAPCLDFWGRIGFAPTVTVPDKPPFGFAILARNGIEVMLQSRDSVKEDTGSVAARVSASLLYLSVERLQPVLEALDGAPVVVPRRTTFYGSDEIYVLDPAGNVIGFAAPSAGAEA